jgi:hypothetical protein
MIFQISVHLRQICLLTELFSHSLNVELLPDFNNSLIKAFKENIDFVLAFDDSQTNDITDLGLR